MSAPQSPQPQYPGYPSSEPQLPRRRRRIWPWFAMAAGALLVVAIGATVSTTPPSSPPAIAAASGAASSTAAPPAAAADGSADHPLPFGKTWAPAGKMAVTIGVPAAYTPSAEAFSPDHSPRAVVMDVTITNVPGAPVVPAMAISIQATAGTSQVQQIEDVGNKVGSPTANILPGKSLTWKVAFGLPAGQVDFTVQVSTMFGGQTVYFTGKIS